MKLKLSIITLLMGSGLAAGAQTVTLDYYFNHEVHKDKTGQLKRFHYMWNETNSNGFSIFGEAFTKQGAKLDTLGEAPTAQNLNNTAIYIIVDPDSKKENPNPSYIQPKDADEIAAWVKKGGVLLMMANDSANVELPHFNTLANKFGVNFNNELTNHVIDDAHFEDGGVTTTGNLIFKTAGKIYMKDVCSISVSGPAKSVLKNKDNATIIASAKYGKGTVVAVGDPWLYNEYSNGRLPAALGFENDKAANDVAQWLLKLVPHK